MHFISIMVLENTGFSKGEIQNLENKVSSYPIDLVTKYVLMYLADHPHPLCLIFHYTALNTFQILTIYLQLNSIDYHLNQSTFDISNTV